MASGCRASDNKNQEAELPEYYNSSRNKIMTQRGPEYYIRF